VPKLWTDTIEAHRQAVRDATLDATASLVAQHGLRGVTMAQIAQAAGIGRATLYKYFSDVDAILVAWHERQIAAHLAEFAELRRAPGSPGQRLETALGRFAEIQQQQHGTETASLLHRGEHVALAERHLRALLEELLAEAAEAGTVRTDVAARELAAYCLHALTAAASLPSRAAVRRLVQVTLSGLDPREDAQAKSGD
jgi:AcrR family transcriptional regulator